MTSPAGDALFEAMNIACRNVPSLNAQWWDRLIARFGIHIFL